MPDQFDLTHRLRGKPAARPASFQSTAMRNLVVWLSNSCTTSIDCATTPGYLLANNDPSHAASGVKRPWGRDAVRAG